jgi:hypothetical protein
MRIQKFFKSAGRFAVSVFEFASASCLCGFFLGGLAMLGHGTADEVVVTTYGGAIFAGVGGGLLMLLCEGPHWLRHRRVAASAN